MDELRSTRYSSRARTSSQRGFALVAAIFLAVLYFGLVELMLIDASRELAEARRFRARIVALTLAENGAELAAVRIAHPDRMMHEGKREDDQGTMEGRMTKNAGGLFDIEAKGETVGVTIALATVHVRGRITGNQVRIDYTMHTP